MHDELSPPHACGADGYAVATPEELAAIVAALDAYEHAAPASALATENDSRWKRAGRTYDAYDAQRGRDA